MRVVATQVEGCDEMAVAATAAAATEVGASEGAVLMGVDAGVDAVEAVGAAVDE